MLAVRYEIKEGTPHPSSFGVHPDAIFLRENPVGLQVLGKSLAIAAIQTAPVTIQKTS